MDVSYRRKMSIARKVNQKIEIFNVYAPNVTNLGTYYWKFKNQKSLTVCRHENARTLH